MYNAKLNHYLMTTDMKLTIQSKLNHDFVFVFIQICENIYSKPLKNIGVVLRIRAFVTLNF